MTGCAHPPERLETLFRARDYVTDDTFEIRRCGQCGLTLTWPLLEGERLSRYYPDAYYGRARERRFVGSIERLQRLLYASRARWVERATGGSPGRVLDVGCGRGFLLEAFRARGWEVQGTERSAEASAHAREALHLPVHHGGLEDAAFAEGSFDAVCLWHVLEHLAHPAAMLAEVARVLRPGGVLFVGVPNFGSPEARLTGPGWFHLDVPRHLVHFTPDSLARVLAEAGFEVESSRAFAPEYDFFSFVQSILNRAGLRQNALYDVLRGGAAKLKAKGGAASAMASVALAVPLGALSVGTLALAATGLGSSWTVLARRR